MKCNIWKVLFAFSVLLMFAFAGELAAEELTIDKLTSSIQIQTSVSLTATLTTTGTPPVPIEGDTIVFASIAGLGTLNPDTVETNSLGRAVTSYTAGTVTGVDTVETKWVNAAGTDSLMVYTVITITPGAPAKVRTLPTDTTVVVTEGATITAEIKDNFDNHIDAASATQVTFSAPAGQGTFGTPVVNDDNNIEIVYNTDDTIATDVITATYLSFHDYDTVNTVGAAPASMDIWNDDDSTLVVSDLDEEEDIYTQIFDEYGNISVYADYYEDERYEVVFTVSTGGGDFDDDTVSVETDGTADTDYNSSTVAGVYTVTATSGDAINSVDITQIPDYPDELVLTPDSAGIPSGTDTTFTVRMYDQFGNHCDANDFGSLSWGEAGLGGFAAAAYIDETNWKRAYHSYEDGADTALIYASWEGVADTVVLFSAEPGDFDHYGFITVADSAHVSDGVYSPSTVNIVRIEAQDNNNIRLYTYDNDDTLDLALIGSSATEEQVTWFIPMLYAAIGYSEPEGVPGLTAVLPPSAFSDGWSDPIGIANQIAETANVTATDTAGHTGTSHGITWLPIGLAGFRIELLSARQDTMGTNDTTDIQVSGIDMFGNVTDSLLPRNIVLSANRTGVTFPAGATHNMRNAVETFPTVAAVVCSGLIITAADIADPSIYGDSDPIEVIEGSGVNDVPIVSNISVKFVSGDVVYSIAKAGLYDIKVYNKVGMEVATLSSGQKLPGYYQASLKGLNLSSDVYFVVMTGPDGLNKKVKTAVIK